MFKFLVLALTPVLFASADVFSGFEWGTVSATGLLGWYLWYTTKVVLPQHEHRVTTLHSKCTEEMRLQRDHYERLLDDMQERHELRHKEIVCSLEKIAGSLDK